MIKFFLLIISFISLYNLQAHEQTSEAFDKIKLAKLQGSCNIKIIKTKLTYANQQKIDTDSLTLVLYKLYDECSPIINSPRLPHLSQSQWTQNMIQEILTIQKDDETRNCLNKAMETLKNLKEDLTEHEKDQLFKEFYNNVRACCDQYTFNTSLSHLNALIERWEHQKQSRAYACNKMLPAIILQHTQGKTNDNDLNKDLQSFHTTCSDTSSNNEFNILKENVINKAKQLQQDPQSYNCIEKLVNFQKAYESAQTQEEKDKLKQEFAIPYYQCKSKKI